MIDDFVSVTDLMKVSIKIYAEGGENFLHTHMAEDLLANYRPNHNQD